MAAREVAHVLDAALALIVRDAAGNVVRRVTGRVVYRDDRYMETGAIDNLQIGDQLFEFHDALRTALPEDTRVTAYYTPYRRVLVAIEPADPPAD